MHLSLVDNQGTQGVLARARSSAHVLNSVLRRTDVVVLTGLLRLLSAYVAMDVNPADVGQGAMSNPRLRVDVPQLVDASGRYGCSARSPPEWLAISEQCARSWLGYTRTGKPKQQAAQSWGSRHRGSWKT